MQDINTLVAITTKKNRKFLKVSASGDWLEQMKITDPEQGRAVVVERAYKLLELQRLAGTEKIEASSFHFTTRGIPGAVSLIPGMEPAGAVTTWCCICNDATPPECACVPC
jgi:hypothetical protein